MHEITEAEGNLVRVVVSGKLTQEDYDALIPAWEQTIARHGSMRMLLVMENFAGWEPHAAWDDFRFNTTHADKVEKVAAVGEEAWQKWIMKLGSFFVRDDVRYFDSSQLAEAERWVRE
ncbi:MAG: STAS/SEC14 domain-containing protein [Chthoniobacterales bacterium]